MRKQQLMIQRQDLLELIVSHTAEMRSIQIVYFAMRKQEGTRNPTKDTKPVLKAAKTAESLLDEYLGRFVDIENQIAKLEKEVSDGK